MGKEVRGKKEVGRNDGKFEYPISSTECPMMKLRQEQIVYGDLC
jgi:hypothetical protein